MNRRTIRLRGYDYSQSGYYFVTICVQNRLCLFGDIKHVGADLCVRPNDIGCIIEYWWRKIPNAFPGVCLDQFQWMPNHVHGILAIGAHTQNVIEGQTHGFAGRTRGSAPTLGTIIQWYKTMTTNAYFSGVRQYKWPMVNRRLWQRNYYERIIRSEKEYWAIRQYIKDNPKNWESDTEFVGGL